MLSITWGSLEKFCSCLFYVTHRYLFNKKIFIKKRDKDKIHSSWKMTHLNFLSHSEEEDGSERPGCWRGAGAHAGQHTPCLPANSLCSRVSTLNRALNM